MSIPTSATGGAGSYPRDTLATSLFGIDRIIDGAASYLVARENRRASEATDQREINANGDDELAGAPETRNIGFALANPYVLGGAALLVGVIIFLAVRK